LEAHSTPEILRTPLHEVALRVKLLGLGSISAFLAKAMQPPQQKKVIESEILLQGLFCVFLFLILFVEMNALDINSELTPLGRMLARLPIDPLIGRSILLSTVFSYVHIYLLIVVILFYNIQLCRCNVYNSGVDIISRTVDT
jgi:ATP-dependent RNA helicase A